MCTDRHGVDNSAAQQRLSRLLAWFVVEMVFVCVCTVNLVFHGELCEFS